MLNVVIFASRWRYTFETFFISSCSFKMLLLLRTSFSNHWPQLFISITCWSCGLFPLAIRMVGWRIYFGFISSVIHRKVMHHLFCQCLKFESPRISFDYSILLCSESHKITWSHRWRHLQPKKHYNLWLFFNLSFFICARTSSSSLWMKWEQLGSYYTNYSFIISFFAFNGSTVSTSAVTIGIVN